MDGILIVNKEKGYTSRDVVNKVSKILKTKKIGHTGTLDPIATGVLVLCIGNATKLVEIITDFNKEYIASVRLGIKTDTLDITGNILSDEKILLSKDKIEEVLKSFVGSYNQTVPIYSAVKINGKKLYEYARNKEEVVLPSRQVTIDLIDLIDYKISSGYTDFKFICTVSKGTYIRALIRDIGLKLNTNAVMTDLNRTKQGKFDIKEAFRITDIENNKYILKNIDDYLIDIKVIIVDEELETMIKNGRLLKNIYGTSPIVFKNKKGVLLSIYKEYNKDLKYIKPWKMFKGGEL